MSRAIPAEPVLTAGGLRVEREGKAYCPPAASLDVALTALAGLGVPADRLRVENRPPACGDPLR
jgi:hypothetical protein